MCVCSHVCISAYVCMLVDASVCMCSCASGYASNKVFLNVTCMCLHVPLCDYVLCSHVCISAYVCMLVDASICMCSCASVYASNKVFLNVTCMCLHVPLCNYVCIYQYKFIYLGQIFVKIC